jgi:hypothetical protein
MRKCRDCLHPNLGIVDRQVGVCILDEVLEKSHIIQCEEIGRRLERSCRLGDLIAHSSHNVYLIRLNLGILAVKAPPQAVDAGRKCFLALCDI